MARLDRREAALWFVRFAPILVVLAIPWPHVSDLWSRAYGRFVNALVLDHVTFGKGGHALMREAADTEKGAGENVTTDAVLAITVDHKRGEMKLGMSLRRDGYLPMAIALAVIAASPLAWRRKLRAAAVAVPTMLVLTIGCQLWLLLWLFSTRLQGVLTLGSGTQSAVNAGFEALLLPPANRHLVPLLVGVALSWWQSRGTAKPAAIAAVAPNTATPATAEN